MLKTTPIFPEKGMRARNGVRCRVIGTSGESNLLFSINSVSDTSILLVRPDGTETIVILFRSYLDLISADLSPDFQILHYTERIANEKGFLFTSYLLNISNASKTKLVTTDVPPVGFFLPFHTSKTYELFHIIGQRITHLKIKMERNDFTYEKLRCGLHLSKAYSWQYNRNEPSISAIYESNDSTLFSVFKIGTKSIQKLCEHRVLLETPVSFPIDAAMDATSLCHLPKFLTLTQRIYTAYYNDTCVIIQQFYSPNSCVFSVSSYPGTFFMKYQIHDVPSNYPVCYFQYGPLIVIFIFGHFTLFIDISGAEVTECMFSSEFWQGQPSLPTASIDLPYSFIDLAGGKTMCLSLDFMIDGIKDITAKQWNSLIFASANLGIVNNVIQLISIVTKSKDVDALVRFIYKYFKYNYVEFDDNASSPIIDDNFKSQIEYIAFNFPSIGGTLRKQVLYGIIEKIKNENNISDSDATEYALEVLVAQNNAMKVMHDAIDLWVRLTKPPTDLVVMINFACNCICQHLNLPGWKVRIDAKHGQALSVVSASCSKIISEDDALGAGKTSDDVTDFDQSEASSMIEMDAL